MTVLRTGPWTTLPSGDRDSDTTTNLLLSVQDHLKVPQGVSVFRRLMTSYPKIYILSHRLGQVM